MASVGMPACCKNGPTRYAAAVRNRGQFRCTTKLPVMQPGRKRSTIPPVACEFDDMQGYPSVEAGIEEPNAANDTRLPVTVRVYIRTSTCVYFLVAS